MDSFIESVTFTYQIDDDPNSEYSNSKNVIITREAEGGLNAQDLCEAFEEFMTSAGFSEQSIYDYFNE